MTLGQGQHPWLCISASLLALMPIVGCSPSTGSVTGQVSFNGQPLDEALILFRPVENDVAASQAPIQAGSYKIDELSAGDYRVCVVANRKTGRKVPVLDVKKGQRPTVDEEVVQVIPMQYNARTELKATIQAGENQHDFTLSK